MRKITDFPIVKSMTSVFNIDLSLSKAKIEETVKEAVLKGQEVNAPDDEQLAAYTAWLKEYEQELEVEKEGMSIPDMEQAQRDINKAAAIIDRAAKDSFNYKSASLKKDKNNLQELSKSMEQLASVYDANIAAVKAAKASERIEFLKTWTIEELKGRDVYEFAHNWDLYYTESMTTADGSVNRGKEGNITSPSKDTRTHILNMINQFESDKKVITQHEYSSILFDYYVKSGYVISEALNNVAEYQRLEEKRKAEEAERERQRLEREEADRKAAEEAETKKQAEAEASFKVINDPKEAVQFAEALKKGFDAEPEEEPAPVVEEAVEDRSNVVNAVANQIEELEKSIFYEEMQERADHAQIAEWRKAIDALKGVKGANSPAVVIYTLTTNEAPTTQLGALLKRTGCKVNPVVTYEVEIEAPRAGNFEKWLNENKIQWKRG